MGHSPGVGYPSSCFFPDEYLRLFVPLFFFLTFCSSPLFLADGLDLLVAAVKTFFLHNAIEVIMLLEHLPDGIFIDCLSLLLSHPGLGPAMAELTNTLQHNALHCHRAIHLALIGIQELPSDQGDKHIHNNTTPFTIIERFTWP